MFSAQKKIFLFASILFVGLLALVGFMLSRKYSQDPSPKSGVFVSTSTLPTKTSSTVGTQIYRNTEYGFEFQYPKNWKLEENSFYSPFSKFNLQGDSSAENYNPFRSHFLLNIVTFDFAERAVTSFKNLNANKSVITIGGITGGKYEYKFEDSIQISIDIPFGEYHMILGTEKEYEDVFNQIISTFKFF